MTESAPGELADFCARLRRLRSESGSPPLAWLSQDPLCPAKSQLSKIFRGQIRRVPDPDVVRGIVRRCARWARHHGHRPLLPTDEPHWLVERDIVERRLDRATGTDGHPELRSAAAAKYTLPRDLATFFGRDDQLRSVINAVDVIDAGTERDRVVEIRSIDGMPGVGKTVFAVHLAHRLAERFPDGQYFVDLHAYTQGRRPVSPGDALEGLLLAVGVAPTAVPREVDARAALWRDRMATKTALLLLDNVREYEQIRPLLPASPRCLVLVTGRRRLTALQDSHPLTLDVLTSEEAAALLLRLARPRDVDAESVAELTRLCGNLPLAISLLAGRLRHHPTWTLRYLTRRVANAIASTRDRLGEFRAENVAVAAAFEVSYRELPPETQRLFRRLSLHTGPDIDADAAAALDDADVDDVVDRLEQLYDDHLLVEYRPGRYRFHDLIRVYATELASLDSEADRTAARQRLLDHYLRLTAAATTRLPTFLEHAPAAPSPPAHGPVFPDRAAALERLDAEHGNLFAYASGESPYAVDIAIALHPYLRLRGHHRQAQAIYHNALTTAGASGASRGHLLNRLTVLQRLTGDFDAARDNALRAQALCADIGDQFGEAIALYELGYLLRLALDADSAQDALDRAYRLFVSLGDRRGQASVLMRLGIQQRWLGDLGAAKDTLARARDTFVEIGDRFGECSASRELGILQRFTDDYPAARDNLTRAHDIAAGLGVRHAQGSALMVLGWVHRLLGDHDTAHKSLDEARRIAEDIDDRLGLVNVLNELGVLQWVIGDHDTARETFTRAHDIAVDIGFTFGQAESLRNLGMVEGATGDRRRARTMIDECYEQCRANQDRFGQAEALSELAVLQHLDGEHDSARRKLVQALEIVVELGSRGGAVSILHRLAAVELDQDHIGTALDHGRRALALAEEIRSPIEQARAHEGLGRCHRADGDHAKAIAHLRRAEEIYRRLGVPDAARIRRELRDHHTASR